jgi:diguanylate cyclase (GGDEF)-like protein/PAS domain S-box-containing protein
MPVDDVVDRITRTLTMLLDHFPHAPVAAIGGEVSPVMVPVPGSVSLGDHPVLSGISTLDVVVPVDRVVVTKLWAQARSQGIACSPVRMLDHPERPTMLYFVDARNVHGVILAVFADGQAESGDPLVDAARLPSLPPRFARATKDATAFIRSADEALTQLLGWAAGELVGRRTLEFIHPDDRELAIANWMEMLSCPGVGHRVRLRHLHRDRTWVWLEITNHNRLDDPDHGDVLADMVDISEEMAAQEALRAREQLLGQLAETVPLGLFHIDRSGSMLFANERLGEITGVTLGSRLTDQLARVVPDQRPMVDQAVMEALAGNGRDLTVPIEPANGGGVRHCALRMRPLIDGTGAVSGVTGCLEDITDSVRMRQELELQATHDPLTGCLNRGAVLAALEEVLRSAHTERRRMMPSGTAAIFLDLDQFKQVNDTLGHAAGDELLVQVADRLRSSVRSDDAVGRLGGDEFLVVCTGVHTADDARRVARTIAARVCGEVELGTSRVEVSVSAGVAWTDDPDADADQVVAAADAAMYESKRSERGLPGLA